MTPSKLWLSALVAAGLLPGCGFGATARTPVPTVEALPSPTRFEAAIVEFEVAARREAPPEDAVLCVGSSSMRMWHDRLAVDLAPLTVIGRGFGGSTWLDVHHYLDRLVVGPAPRAVVIYEGDNDIDFGATADETFALARATVEGIRDALPDVRIYIVSTKPCPARWDHWPEMKRLNTRLVEWCERDAKLWFVDVATPMLDENGRPHGEIFLDDGIHMNDAGYDIWKDVARGIIVANEEPYER